MIAAAEEVLKKRVARENKTCRCPGSGKEYF